MEGPARGVGAEPLDTCAAPLLVGGVRTFVTVAAAVSEDPLAKCQDDRHGEVRGTFVDRRTTGRAATGARLLVGEAHARRRRVDECVVGRFGVPPTLDVLVLEFDRDHPLHVCLLYTSPSPRDRTRSRMPSSA